MMRNFFRGNGRAETAPKIFVCTHVPYDYPKDPGYIPIHAGKAVAVEKLDLLGDDTHDNISSLNPWFAELTALYWIWKNDTSDIVGLAHYRRYFSARQDAISFQGQQIASSGDFSDIGSTLDLIVASPLILTDKTGNAISVEEQYVAVHLREDLFMVRQMIAELHSDYLSAFDFVMRNCQLSPCNMIVTRRETLDSYCSWLFSILFSIEKRSPYRHYSGYQIRIFGFLAERLMNVWIIHNRSRLRIGYRDIVMC